MLQWDEYMNKYSLLLDQFENYVKEDGLQVEFLFMIVIIGPNEDRMLPYAKGQTLWGGS